MSGNESVVEEIVELGIEVIKPGGRPEELEAAAKAWRRLKSEVEDMVRDLDKSVGGSVGEAWRGEAARAFQAHWDDFAAAVLSATDDFGEAAQGLDTAAKNIREVNEEIEDIYLEIGISVGVSVGMSFLTLGVSAAVGTARVAMLAGRALDAAGRLGKALRTAGAKYRALYNSRKAGRLVAEGLLNWAGGTAGGVITSKAGGRGWEFGTNMIGGLAGATVGTAAGKAATALGGGDMLSGAAGGAAGAVSGDYLGSLRPGEEEFDLRQSAVSAVAGGAAGGLGGGARAIDRDLDGMARGLRNDNDFAYAGRRPEHEQTGVDAAFGASVPVAGGVSANTAKDRFDRVDACANDASTSPGRGVHTVPRSATDRIREDFG